MALIEPRTLKGFRDYLPEAMMPRERLIETARKVYRSYGFVPIDTPALEYEEILTGKGGDETDKQLYRFEDHGGRRVALRFDLTVPLARFIAQYHNDLGLPFKRYHIASVWRGENTQRGRYREFMQCDFDTIGSENVTSDIETALVIHDLFRAIGFDDFTIKINDRRLLIGLLKSLGVNEHIVPVLRAIDKLDKQGPERVIQEITQLAGLSTGSASKIVLLSNTTLLNYGPSGPEKLNSELEQLICATPDGQRGWESLQTIRAGFESAVGSSAATCLRFDFSIARGLDYYTGTVFETVLGALPSIGSVCSGGRYDNLAQLYTKERLPGIGASLGLDRLLAAMEELGLVDKKRTGAPVFIAYFDEARRNDYLRLAARLRGAGLGVEFYPEPKKLGAQLKYADRRGFRFAIVAGEDEWKSGAAQVKTLASQSSQSVPMFDASGAAHPDLVRILSM